MKTCLRHLTGIVFLILLTLLWSCTAKKLVSNWRDCTIDTDGHDSEWQGDPLYLDENRQIAIYITNDSEAIFLCLSTANEGIKKQLRMAGLTVWIDPEGGKEQVFGIHLPGLRDFKQPNRELWSGEDALPLKDNCHRPADNKQRRISSPEQFKEVEIIYGDTTGPLMMKIDEVRQTGIDIGMAQSQDGRLVYEFKIQFRAAFSLSALKPDKLAGIGILAGGKYKQDILSRPDRSGRSFPDGEIGQGNPPGGGMGDRPPPAGKMGDTSHDRRPGGKNAPLEIWLQVQLAGQP